MLLTIGTVLSAQQLTEIRQLLDDQPFDDGRTTAGWAAQRVKNNKQLSTSAPNHARLQQMILQALNANAVFPMAAMVKSMRPVLFSRYETGMQYGEHVDNALMGDELRVRSDLSFTLFLSNPDEYSGGELVVDEASSTQSFKMPAGSMVLYSSSYLHRVEPVTRGTRLVAVGWVQSLIRRDDQRQVLFDLEILRRQMFQKEGKTPAFDLLSKNVANLWRMWAEP